MIGHCGAVNGFNHWCHSFYLNGYTGRIKSGIEMDPGIKIRKAKLCEGPVLTDLALRSKTYWGYDAQFIEKC